MSDELITIPQLDGEIEPKESSPFMFGSESRGSTATEGTGKRRGRPPGSANRKKLESLEKPLAEKMVEYIGVPIAFASPLACAVVEDRADRTAKALVRLGSRSPRVLKGIEAFIEGSDYLALVTFPLGIAAAFMVDFQRIRPDSKPAKAFKIDQFYEELYGPMGSDVTPDITVERRGIM